MTLLITAALLALAAYFGWLAGRRKERGLIEAEAAAAEAEAYQRSKRSRSVRLNTMQIRR